MPVAPTYPGVYIEEIPSGVRTITGVSTSVTAFIGYTLRGSIDEAVRILSYGDFERAFGGLAVDSAVSYAVKQFLQNGGSEAWVVRVAQGAAAAAVTLLRGTAAGSADAFRITAAGEGAWGNLLHIGVDYDTGNPASLFNLTVTEMVEREGQFQAGATEVFRNLSMNSTSRTYVERIVNAGSELIRVKRQGPASTTDATSVSGSVTQARLDPVAQMTRGRLAYSLDGQGPFEIEVHSAASPLFPAGASLDTQLGALGAKLVADATARFGAGRLTFTHAAGSDTITFTSPVPGGGDGERLEISFYNASSDDMAAIFRLGLANGGVETEGAASMRPAQTGTVGAVMGAARDAFTSTATASGGLRVQVIRREPTGTSTTIATHDIALWGPNSGTPPAPKPTTVDGVVAALRAALDRTPPLAGAVVALLNRRIRVSAPPGPEPGTVWQLDAPAAADTTAAEIQLASGAADENLAAYSPSGPNVLAQAGVTPGADGTPPATTTLYRGNQADKTGLYALEDVDLFNILCIPGRSDADLLAEAIHYCEQRRAFFIVDLPDTVNTLRDAERWMTTGDGSTLRSRNAAVYFPRIQERDPMFSGELVRDFPNSGAMAGVYARTDAERGVWKAPAGTGASISGASGLKVALTDRENGVLNPLGLNCLRTFPVYGTVSWGARTMKGADQMADEYKYVPVRRLALYLEESLYRGTKWVVFEPNDEPLWAQIRLNVGAFMHTLYAQGAFQGRTPRDAYLVKCDGETTTQNDIDLGRVNIVVGFAPLKPAEFVIIKIQQIARAVQT